jgi:hypothetical protein
VHILWYGGVDIFNKNHDFFACCELPYRISIFDCKAKQVGQ